VTVLEDILAGGAPRLLRFGSAAEDSCDIGLPCGGEIEIWTEPFDPAGLQARFHRLVQSGAAGALVTALDDAPEPCAKLLIIPGETSLSSLGDPELDAQAVTSPKRPSGLHRRLRGGATAGDRRRDRCRHPADQHRPHCRRGEHQPTGGMQAADGPPPRGGIRARGHTARRAARSEPVIVFNEKLITGRPRPATDRSLTRVTILEETAEPNDRC
jgi:xanthine/CO dehydrogenase XdhC/CoxF family maturation factor